LFHALSNSKYSFQTYNFPKTNQAGMDAFYKWLKWTHRQVKNNDFMDSFAKLEEKTQEKKHVRKFAKY
jgi:hypothetical protein